MKKITISANIFRVVIIIGFFSTTPACSKFIDMDPPRTEIVSETVFSNDASAVSAIRGIYSLMMTNLSFTYARMEEYTGITSDELINYATSLDQLQFYQNAVTPINGNLFQIFWQEPYKYINNANSILEGIQNSTGMTSGGKKQIEGEAKFIRAFCHFYMAALFGDIPYVTTASYQVNSTLSRTPFREVLLKIETDLLDARNLLADDFSFSNGERIQPNKGAATALLARVYLYLGNWQKAEAMATELINNTTYSLLTDLNSVFLANSKEAIWQLQPVVPGTNTPQGQVFILLNAPNSFSRRVSMTPQLVSAFETGDQRKSNWTSTFINATGSWSYFYKYKVRLGSVVTEYSMILRLAEQYLIRAEARTNLDNLDGAKADINAIRTRAGLLNTTATNKVSLLSAIEQERRIELCGEFGHRWLDLKRTKRADAVLSVIKPGWQPTDTLFPIPQSEILLNPHLTQNAGY
jgi:starch-binding outer membrane protein, SusD/RagB family